MSEQHEGIDRTQPTSIEGWKGNRDHLVVLPSSTVVKIRIPDLPALVETGTIPQHLLDEAASAAKGVAPKPTREAIAQEREFVDLLVTIAVVEPKLAPEDLAEIPYEDKDKIVSIACRIHDVDAEGNHISGLDKSEKFRRFRRLGEFQPTLEDL